MTSPTPPQPPVAPRVGEDVDDGTLAVRAQEGDVAALERLFRRHQQAMFRLALRILGDHSDAEDALQEAFVAAWRNLDSYRGQAVFSTWLYRIVTNRCLNMTRARHHHLTVTLDAAETMLVAGAKDSPEAAGVVDAEHQALRHALMTLPADQRACWVLRENDRLGYHEIGEIIGISPDAVRGRIHRARRSLVQIMRDWQ